MSVRSPSGASGAATGSTPLPTGRLSPVSAASATSSVAAASTRPSAGTTSPASISTTSPGTSSLGRQLRERAVAAHARLDDHHLRQRGDGRRGLALLAEPEHRVEQRQQQDHDPRAGLLDRVDRDHARRPAARSASGPGTGAGTRASAARSWPRRSCSARSFCRRAAASAPSGPPRARRPTPQPRPRPPLAARTCHTGTSVVLRDRRFGWWPWVSSLLSPHGDSLVGVELPSASLRVRAWSLRPRPSGQRRLQRLEPLDEHRGDQACVSRLWSAGMTCHGAHGVDVAVARPRRRSCSRPSGRARRRRPR